MTVHFKGISEYQNKYKVRHRRSRSASPHRRMRLAGLRSDEQGISREPQFQTKRRVPINPPQVSSSLQWKGSSVLSRQQDITKPRSPPGVPGALTCSEEKVETPLAPRASQPQEEEVPSAQTQDPSADQQTQRTLSNKLNHVLRRKAGLKSECRRNGVWDSEYHGQFQWKTPVSESPLLTAQQMLYKGNRRIPPFKSGPAVTESEYTRSFKGSPPPRPPRLRRDVELNAVSLSPMENPSPDKSQTKKKKKQKQKEQHLSRRFSPKQEALPQEPAKQKVTSPHAQSHVSPKVKRKPKTEYSSNFHSPLQYCYRDGMWVKSRTLREEVHVWHHEVRELREKAEAYRKRAWGTHFCRQHLSQIMSTQNYLWEASSSASSPSPSEEDDCCSSSSIIEALDLARVDSVGGNSSRGTSVTMTTSRRSSAEGAGTSKGPTLPVQRKLAWEEEAGPCERGVAQIKEQREEPPFQQPMETEEREAINSNLEDKKNEVTETGNDTLSPEDVSAHLSEEGRVPTPKMKTMLNTKRTHHDRTTPATGGAVLVSPPKTHCTRRTRRSEPPLGKADSPYRHLSHGSPPQAHSKAESGCRPCSVLAAGMATADPLPLSEDVWAADGSTASPEPTPARTPHKLAARASAGSPSHENRIQGTLRNPEFQHNGNLGLHRPGTFLSPSSDSGVSDNDDRMSQISCRSAASCFMASQVLDRAHKRKQEFWGKS